MLSLGQMQKILNFLSVKNPEYKVFNITGPLRSDVKFNKASIVQILRMRSSAWSNTENLYDFLSVKNP